MELIIKIKSRYTTQMYIYKWDYTTHIHSLNVMYEDTYMHIYV